MKKRRLILFLFSFVILGLIVIIFFIQPKDFNPNVVYKFGDKLDSLNGVYVYYNGSVSHTEGRNKSADGYNLGIKFQCVEFVKRYYFKYYKHRMPDTYGNAKDFFNSDLKDSSLNTSRDLIQFTNPSKSMPKAGDLLIMDGHPGNKYGHVAIISLINNSNIEIIQQNPGPFAPSRVIFGMESISGKWEVNAPRVLGWLRIK